MDRRIGREGSGQYARSRRKTPLPEGAERVRRWLKKLMRDGQVTQMELAEAAGVTQAQICRVLTGASEMKVGTLVRMVEGLGYRLVFVPAEQFEQAKARKAEALREQRDG